MLTGDLVELAAIVAIVATGYLGRWGFEKARATCLRETREEERSCFGECRMSVGCAVGVVLLRSRRVCQLYGTRERVGQQRVSLGEFLTEVEDCLVSSLLSASLMKKQGAGKKRYDRVYLPATEACEVISWICPSSSKMRRWASDGSSAPLLPHVGHDFSSPVSIFVIAEDVPTRVVVISVVVVADMTTSEHALSCCCLLIYPDLLKSRRVN